MLNVGCDTGWCVKLINDVEGSSGMPLRLKNDPESLHRTCAVSNVGAGGYGNGN